MAPRQPTRHAAPDPAIGEVFAVLEDQDCRVFLRELAESLTAAELSARCDVPSSTTYRKLDRLEAAGLVASVTEVCGQNNHRARYHRTVESVRFSFDGELSLRE